MIWDTADGLSRCSLCPHFFTPCHSNPSPAPSHVPSLFVFIKVLSVAFLSSHTAQPAAPNFHSSPDSSIAVNHSKAISNMLWKSRTKTDPYCAQVSKHSARLIVLLIKLFISVNSQLFKRMIMGFFFKKKHQFRIIFTLFIL